MLSYFCVFVVAFYAGIIRRVRCPLSIFILLNLSLYYIKFEIIFKFNIKPVNDITAQSYWSMPCDVYKA